MSTTRSGSLTQRAVMRCSGSWSWPGSSSRPVKRTPSASWTRAALGPASLVLFDVTTLYFETHQGDGFREPGFSKERRLEPQITVGMLTDAAGRLLLIEAFEGNKAETKTMLPTLQAFMAAHALQDVTVVADAGMFSEANREAIEDAGLSYIIGARIPHEPYQVKQWRREHPDAEIPDGHVFTAPWPAAGAAKAAGRRDKVTYYRYKADSARRTLRGIETQVAKAERAVAGKEPVKRNRFVTLTGGQRTVNRDLEAKARALAGFKAYITNMPDPTPEFVIGAYHQLWHIEKSFRMSKHAHRAGRSTTTSASPSTRTSRSCSQHSRYPATSRSAPAGRSSGSSGPHAATAPSRSASAGTSSPQNSHCPTTSETRSPSSTDRVH